MKKPKSYAHFLKDLPTVTVSRHDPPDEAAARKSHVKFRVRSAEDIVQAFNERPRDPDKHKGGG
jgi:hypothetical protein